MKESMNQLQITALSRVYAEWMIKDAKCEDLPNCLKKTLLASNTEYAEEVIRWLLSRYNLVEKSAYDLGKQKETITQEEIENEAVDYAFGENKKRPDARPDTAPEYACEDLIDAFKVGANFALGKQEKDADTVIQGWLVRDKDGTLNLFYGSDKPIKRGQDEYWSVVAGAVFEYLPIEMFPDLTWDDDPQEVKIIIKKKKK